MGGKWEYYLGQLLDLRQLLRLLVELLLDAPDFSLEDVVVVFEGRVLQDWRGKKWGLLVENSFKNLIV